MDCDLPPVLAPEAHGACRAPRPDARPRKAQGGQRMSRQEATPVGDVSFDGERATLNFEIRLPHPPEEVWKAITDPRELSQWCMTQAVIEGRKGGFIDLRTGPGQFHEPAL